MPNMPKWLLSDRKLALIRLFYQSKGFCVFGHKNCKVEAHDYNNYIEPLIADWKAEDKADFWALLRLERECLHHLTGQRLYPLTGQFSGVSRDIFFDSQPRYYIEDYGLSGINLKPFVSVRLSSSGMRLHVNLDDTLKRLSKNKRRKLCRYNKGGLSPDIQQVVDDKVDKAVNDYLR